MNTNDHKQKLEVKRVGGYLKEIVTFLDDSGQPIGHVMNPLMVELKPRDIAQIFVGSLVVASPLCLTEEVWKLSEELPMMNIYWLMLSSFIVVLSFVYFNFYRYKLKGHIINFIKRIFAVYFISTLSVVLMLLLVGKFPIEEMPLVTIKRVILVGFPSIFGGVLTDYLK